MNAVWAAVMVAGPLLGADAIPLNVNQLKAHNVRLDSVSYKGRQAIRVTDAGPNNGIGSSGLAILAETNFQDGTIEVDLTGDTTPDAPPTSRGFTGIAFHVGTDGRYEAFYLRPKNGRAEDQLQRNHSTQYISEPNWPWERLRKEFPGVYESYVDLAPGEWTKMRIEIHGEKGRLYVNGATQPTLIVNDLKLAAASGPVALWIGPGTVAHFANLRISR